MYGGGVVSLDVEAVSKFLKLQDGAVVGVSWPLLSGLASGPMDAH